MNTTRLLCCLGYILLAPFIGGLLDGMDRKLSARMQGRTGPSVLQPFYDIVKLFQQCICFVQVHFQNAIAVIFHKINAAFLKN